MDSLALSHQGSQSYSLGVANSLFVFPLNGAYLCLTSDLPRVNSSLHCLDTLALVHFSLSGQHYIIFLFLCQNTFKKFLQLCCLGPRYYSFDILTQDIIGLTFPLKSLLSSMYSERVILGQEIVKHSLTVSLECGSL